MSKGKAGAMDRGSGVRDQESGVRSQKVEGHKADKGKVRSEKE